MISKCPALLGILNWAEERDQEAIKPEIWCALQLDNFFMTELSVGRLSEKV